MENSFWNDDLKTWKLPKDIENNLKLPPADLRVGFQKKNVFESKELDTYLGALDETDSTESKDSTVSTCIIITDQPYTSFFL